MDSQVTVLDTESAKCDPVSRESDAYDVAVEFTGAMELITTKNNYLNKEEVNMCPADFEALMLQSK